jgi:hypothetical protein
MRYLIPAALALSLLPAAGFAQTTRCTNDGWGNVTCRSSDGSNLRMSDDGWGNIRSTYRDGYGNSSRCTTTDNGWGTITTRCY